MPPPPRWQARREIDGFIREYVCTYKSTLRWRKKTQTNRAIAFADIPALTHVVIEYSYVERARQALITGIGRFSPFRWQTNVVDDQRLVS